MPNIPPLAYSVVKHPVFISAILLSLWWTLCFLAPEIVTDFCTAIGAWFIGVGIYHLSEFISKKLP